MMGSKWRVLRIVSHASAVVGTIGLVLLLSNRLLPRSETPYIIVPGKPDCELGFDAKASLYPSPFAREKIHFDTFVLQGGFP
jgi:hypothetical protein